VNIEKNIEDRIKDAEERFERLAENRKVISEQARELIDKQLMIKGEVGVLQQLLVEVREADL
jgi:hypothetical protein